MNVPPVGSSDGAQQVTLWRLDSRGRLAEPRTLHIGIQLVRALAAAHPP